MDEMNNMNEVAIEETSNEVTPVAENNEVHEEVNSGINTWAGVGVAVAALTIGAAVAAVAKHKAKKAENKPKKHVKFRKPWEVVEDKTEATDVEYKDVVENTTEEEN